MGRGSGASGARGGGGGSGSKLDMENKFASKFDSMEMHKNVYGTYDGRLHEGKSWEELQEERGSHLGNANYSEGTKMELTVKSKSGNATIAVKDGTLVAREYSKTYKSPKEASAQVTSVYEVKGSDGKRYQVFTTQRSVRYTDKSGKVDEYTIKEYISNAYRIRSTKKK